MVGITEGWINGINNFFPIKCTVLRLSFINQSSTFLPSTITCLARSSVLSSPVGIDKYKLIFCDCLYISDLQMCCFTSVAIHHSLVFIEQLH